MALSSLSGAATTTVKVSDFNAMITALNAELAGLGDRIAALESEPAPVIPPDLTTRVEALEHLVQRAPAENPTPAGTFERQPKPANLPADRMVLVYDRATIYYGDLELYADRIGENRWRLYAQLNFIVLSPALWTYDEIFEGDAAAVYRHAVKRLEELNRLKPIHDAVHQRVVAMSEGKP